MGKMKAVQVSKPGGKFEYVEKSQIFNITINTVRNMNEQDIRDQRTKY